MTTATVTTPRWPPPAEGSSPHRVGSAAFSATSWSSTPPRPATCGKSLITRRITCRWRMCARSFCATRTTRRRCSSGPSRLHSLVGAGQTHQSAARVFDADSDSPVAGTVRFEWDRAAVVRGRRADLRPPAQSLFAGRRAALAPARPGRAATASCWPTPGLRCCSSKPVCPQGITSIRPMSPSSIWNPARRRRCARTRE